MKQQHAKLCDDMDVVNDMDMDDDIGKNSRKLNPCNWLQNTKTLKMKNFLKIFKIGRKDDMNKLDLIKFKLAP